jgi:hypothetical protein
MAIEIKEQNGTKLTVDYNEEKKGVRLSLFDYDTGMFIDLDSESLLKLQNAISVIALTSIIK